MEYQKGKLNKFKIGQVVKAKQALVDWIANHLVWLYSTQVKNDSQEREFLSENMEYVYIWLDAQLRGYLPVGKVCGYGAKDNDDNIDRNNLQIIFTFRTKLGNIEYSTFVHEKDLILVKKSK